MIRVNKNKREVVFRQQIIAPRPGSSNENPYADLKLKMDSFTMAPHKEYQAKKFKKFWLGEQYRDLWATEVTVPVIDLEKTHGGLTPIKKGGGMASNSLRLQNPDGKQYILRSVNKELTKVLPPDMRNIKAANIFQDQASANQPFAPITIPTLSKAMGVYYTQPKLVYLAHQPALGAYNDLFPEELYYLEERPTGDLSDMDNFGNSDNIMGYIDVLSKLRSGHDHYVDQKWALKSRLLDLLIHDWDRHDDQWRWASFKEDKKTMYRPIPRDRDQTYYGMKGVIPSLVAVFMVRKFKSFKHDLKDVAGHSTNGRNFDRYFLNELTKEDWLEMAAYAKNQITDDVIEAAIAQWDPKVQNRVGAETVSKLKSRRDVLDEIALELYYFISKEVNVVGTDKKEKFEVERKKNGDTKVQVFALSKKGKKKEKLYERLFKKGETKEIRLYGLHGKDEFEIKGKARKGIKVRIIGGEGNDLIKDESKVGGLLNKTVVYDTKDGIAIDKSGETSVRTKNNLEVNEYNREGFLYNTALPSINFGFTPTDGFWIGAGFTATRHGFRKLPYASKQTFSFSLAPSSRRVFKLNFVGDYINAFRALDFYLGVSMQNPSYVNQYGSGNNTPKIENNNNYHWLKLNNYQVQTLAKKSFNYNKSNIRFGPTFEAYKAFRQLNRIGNEVSYLSPNDDNWKLYPGATLALETNSDNFGYFPKDGIRFSLINQYRFEANDKDHHFVSDGNVTAYISFGNRFETTYAIRLGGGAIWGDYTPYLQPTIGNNNYLRGFDNNRFSGQQFAYSNMDVRTKLFHSNNSFLPFDLGILLGYDIGRVWYENDQTTGDKWHQSITAGIWLTPLNLFVLNPHFSYSKEEKQINVRMGFNF